MERDPLEEGVGRLRGWHVMGRAPIDRGGDSDEERV
jgi:hypothetical protein